MSKSTILLYVATGITLCAPLLFSSYYSGKKDGIELSTKTFKENTSSSSISIDTLWSEINSYKESRNLPTLVTDKKLCEYAQKRAIEVESDWSHRGFFNNLSLTYSKYCPECKKMGENLAMGFTAPREVINAWENSPTHKEILDENFTKGCLGVFEKNGKTYVSLIVSK